jgi:hypothetical protein
VLRRGGKPGIVCGSPVGGLPPRRIPVGPGPGRRDDTGHRPWLGNDRDRRSSIVRQRVHQHRQTTHAARPRSSGRVQPGTPRVGVTCGFVPVQLLRYSVTLAATASEEDQAP